MNLPKYALIDLGTGEIKDYPISKELYENYIGGKAIGSRLLFDLLPLARHWPKCCKCK